MAIAFDATSNSGNQTISGASWNHTTTNNETILVVFLFFESGGGAQNTTNYINHGGAPLTLLRHDGTAIQFWEIWYKVAPSVGTFPIFVSMSGDPTLSGAWGAGAISLTGVDLVNPIDTSGEFDSDYFTSHNASVTITTTADNTWILSMCTYFGGANISPNSGTQRWNFTVASAGYAGTFAGNTHGPITPAGSTTETWILNNTPAGDPAWIVQAVALKPKSSVASKIQGITTLKF